jgi:NAD(P)-dependent dehydrogenase (short-subunit alcohol dehydrogenase family)
MNVVITGASRGIGLGFVRHYLSQRDQVWAVCRQLTDELSLLQREGVRVVYWDVRKPNPETDDVTLPDSIDLLINNAGIYGPTKGDKQGLESVSMDVMHEVFDVDCLGALRVVQHLLPAISKGGGTVANLSSKMGSSADNSSGGCYAYRAAKAALVIVSKSMAMDLAPSGVRVVTLHPGWVRTDMTGFSGLIDVDQSVAGMAAVINRVDDYHPGSFVAFDGQQVPY